MRKKHEKIGIFLCSFGILFSLTTVTASAQSFIETENQEQISTDLGDRSGNSQPWSGLPEDELDELLTSSSDGFLDELLNDVLIPVNNFFDEVYESISPIIDDVKLIYADVNSGLDDVVTTVLGEIGLANPQSEANHVGWTGRYNPPQTPADIARQAETADAQKSQVLSHLSQVIFGENGQKVVNRQNVSLGQTQQVSAQAQAATAQTSQISINVASQNGQRASRIRQLTAQANSSKITQEVMKAIAAQNNEMANINIGISDQLALLGEGQLYSVMQMDGLNTQLTVANQRSQNMETFLAAQNSQLAEIDSNQELQLKRELEKENQARTRNRQGMTKIFIPGLFADSNDTTGVGRQEDSLPEPAPVVSNTLFTNLSSNLNP